MNFNWLLWKSLVNFSSSNKVEFTTTHNFSMGSPATHRKIYFTMNCVYIKTTHRSQQVGPGFVVHYIIAFKTTNVSDLLYTYIYT